ncbi:MAG: type II toxin-antitoxin system death-on-curing family toxin [Alcanivorax sp.]
MSEPEYCDGSIRYLSCEDLESINSWMIEIFTPGEPSGVKFPDLLEIAQQKPATKRYYENTNDLALLAGSLFIGIARLHAFHNANKRTAFGAACMFLRLNGYELIVGTGAALDLAESVVKDHTITAEEVGDWIYCNVVESDAAELDRGDPIIYEKVLAPIYRSSDQ